MDWTEGPAKWIAAVVLGGASIVGMTWSIAARRPIDAPVTTQPVGPAVASSSIAPRPSTSQPTLGGRIDINAAPAAELQMLPGIGPTLAQRIIEDRTANGPFASVDDLQRVRGIGPRTVENLSEMATTGQ